MSVEAATLLSSAPQIYDLMNAGLVGDVLTLAFNTVATSNSLQIVILQLVKDGVSYFAGATISAVATTPLGMDLL